MRYSFSVGIDITHVTAKVGPEKGHIHWINIVLELVYHIFPSQGLSVVYVLFYV